MLSSVLDGPIGAVVFRFAIDVFAMLILLMGIYYRRYGDKELMTSASLFNVFIFAVLTILSSVNFSVNAGFGLFAILALFTLRSEQIGKIEITYFFGSVAIAVICSVQGTTLPFVLATVSILVGSTYLLDHPGILRSVHGVRITLDKIDAEAIANPEQMCTELSNRLGVQVLSFHIISLDFIHDMAVLNVNYRNH
jgi:hypothetical protein